MRIHVSCFDSFISLDSGPIKQIVLSQLIYLFCSYSLVTRVNKI